MRQIKSERLKKLEQELSDLEQWLKLGLVPKSDIERHNEEILTATAKIEEEKERLQFLKESGDSNDFVAPKRQPGRTAYTEMSTMPDIDLSESNQTVADSGFTQESENTESESSIIEESEDTEADKDKEDKSFVEEEEESFFSDRNRWRRGFKDIIDPEANEW